MILMKQAKTSRYAMGLEKMGLNMFEGASTSVSPALVHGKVQHGLENKEDIQVVEKHFGKKLTEDPEFWGRLVLNINHTATTFDPKNGEHVLLAGVLKQQGKLAPSIEEQADPNENYQFVIADEGAEATQEATLQRRRVTALVKLSEIDTKEPAYLIALCKMLCNFQTGIKTKDQAFKKLAELIEGKLSRKANEAVDAFLNALDPQYGGNVPRERTFVRVDVEEAIRKNILRFDRAKGAFVNAALPEDVDYGRDKDAVVDFLLAVTNMDHLGTGTSKDEHYSIRLQLANKRDA